MPDPSGVWSGSSSLHGRSMTTLPFPFLALAGMGDTPPEAPA
ncbi:hypothetical protein [Streptomyces sp. NPDC005423]